MEAKLRFEAPSRTFAKEVRKLDKVVIDTMPVEDNVKCTLSRARRSRYPTIPQNMDGLQIGNEWTADGDGNNFLV